jgi:hypothetical protein
MREYPFDRQCFTVYNLLKREKRGEGAEDEFGDRTLLARPALPFSHTVQVLYALYTRFFWFFCLALRTLYIYYMYTFRFCPELQKAVNCFDMYYGIGFVIDDLS